MMMTRLETKIFKGMDIKEVKNTLKREHGIAPSDFNKYTDLETNKIIYTIKFGWERYAYFIMNEDDKVEKVFQIRQLM